MSVADGPGAPTSPRVILTRRVPADLLSPLAGVPLFMPADEHSTLDRSTILATCQKARGIITAADLRVDGEVLAAAPKLRIVANIARGVDNFDLLALARAGVVATNVPDAFTAPTAETALGLILMVMRKLAAGDRHVRAGEWARFEPGRWDGHSLEGKTLGLIGLGKIGLAVARRAAPFGMAIIFHRRTPGDRDGLRWVPLPELLAGADVVSLHVPATPATHHLINAATLAQMKPGAVLINTARGVVVDEAALVAALAAGRVAGAGLDVAEFEPEVHPQLRMMENVVITPHLGGGTIESRRAARALAIANVVAVLRGAPPLTPIHEGGHAAAPAASSASSAS